MRVDCVYPSGPQAVPRTTHGARPIPLLMIHIANCGRNCGIRKGRPVPAALPKIEEDAEGEAREFAQNKLKVIEFAEIEHPRLWPSERFKSVKQRHIMLHSPPTSVLVDDNTICFCVDSDDDVQQSDEESIPASDSRQLRIFMELNKEARRKDTVELCLSRSPILQVSSCSIEPLDLNVFFRQHTRKCGPKCGRGKRRTQPASLIVITEDIEGETEESEDSSEAPDSAGSDCSSPTSLLSSSSSFTSTIPPGRGEEVAYITSTSGLIGLGLLLMPELTSMSTISSDLELPTPPESPVRCEMDITDYHKSLVGEWLSRFANKTRA